MQYIILAPTGRIAVLISGSTKVDALPLRLLNRGDDPGLGRARLADALNGARTPGAFRVIELLAGSEAEDTALAALAASPMGGGR